MGPLDVADVVNGILYAVGRDGVSRETAERARPVLDRYLSERMDNAAAAIEEITAGMKGCPGCQGLTTMHTPDSCRLWTGEVTI